MKVGVLYPRSAAYPDADIDFVDSLRCCLADSGADKNMQLVLESIGFGGSEKEVYEKVERLLRMERVDVIVGFVDMKVTPLLEPLLYAAGKLIIVVNPGANYPLNWTPQPNIIYLTLQHAFLTWLAGGRAAEQPGARAAVATTFYDCGYLHGATMMDHFLKRGGAPTYNYVNNQSYDGQFEISALLTFLEANPETRKLLCTFDARPAALFYDRLQDSQVAKGMQLFVSPMMLDDVAMQECPADCGFSLDGYLSWLPWSERPENEHFKHIFKESTGRAVSLFSLLGWEAGLLLSLIDALPKDTDAEQIVKELCDQELSTPRGQLKLDEATQFFTGPVWHGIVSAGQQQLNIEAFEGVSAVINLPCRSCRNWHS